MNAEVTAIWNKSQAMINGFMILLPNIILALIVFTLFKVKAKFPNRAALAVRFSVWRKSRMVTARYMLTETTTNHEKYQVEPVLGFSRE